MPCLVWSFQPCRTIYAVNATHMRCMYFHLCMFALMRHHSSLHRRRHALTAWSPAALTSRATATVILPRPPALHPPPFVDRDRRCFRRCIVWFWCNTQLRPHGHRQRGQCCGEHQPGHRSCAPEHSGAPQCHAEGRLAGRPADVDADAVMKWAYEHRLDETN